MSVRIGEHEFERVRYDAEGDVLYLGTGAQTPHAWTNATPEGHAVSFAADGTVTGMTIVNAKWLVERDGKVTVTLPHVIEADARDLAAVLAA